MILFDVINGKFIPKKLETLRPELKKYIGRTFEWQYLWTYEDGVYEGQNCFQVVGNQNNELFHSVPEEDIEVLEK